MKSKSKIKALLKEELLNYKNNKEGICLSSRLYNVLTACGIITIGDLVEKPVLYYDNLTHTKRNFGPIMLKELMVFVECLGLRFSEYSD